MQITQNTSFPKHFLWGASTSSFQFEGGSALGNKGVSVQDLQQPNHGCCDFSVASDHYHHYKEDIALMAEMGFKAYRMSIAWSRILPDGFHLNPKGISFYKNIFNECHRYHIEPIVTIFHFDIPQALIDLYGSWLDRRMIDAYVDYAKQLFKQYKEDVHYWLTFNEQNMLIFFGAVDIMGSNRTFHSDKELYQQAHHQLVAQAKAMILCHELCPTAKIGPVPNITCCYPKTCHPLDYIAAKRFCDLRNYFYLDALVKGQYPTTCLSYLQQQEAMFTWEAKDMDYLKNAHPDFIAFNYYGGATVEHWKKEDALNLEQLKSMENHDISFLSILAQKPSIGKSVSNEYIAKTSYNMNIDPIGLTATLIDLYDRYHLPLIITENGCGCVDELTPDGCIHDDYRIDYLRQHIWAVKAALDLNVDVFGYCPWSAIDLISTREGCRKRYGFVYVNRDDFDVKDLKRIRKDSFYWYQKVIQSNGSQL